MTPDQIALVRDSFRRVPAEAAALFYGRLFDQAPELRPMFRGDMAEQGRKLLAMIAVAVNALDAPERLLPAVRVLGQRHAGYGVVPEHYRVVGAALLWTLREGLGDAFTPETEAAWTAAYVLLSETMIDAAAQRAA